VPRKKAPVDPDALHQRTLRLLEGVIATAETDPVAMAMRGGVETILKISENLRKLNTDLQLIKLQKELAKLSDADLDALDGGA
jgi:hypothetical protein